MTELIWSFSPWVAFLMGVRVGNVYWGAGLAAVAGIVVLARAMSRHKAHLFDTVGVVYFVGLLVLLAIIHPGDISTWGRYAQAVAHGSLTLIVFGSVLVGHPFTERYAREQTPPKGSGTARTFMRSIERSRCCGDWPSWSGPSRSPWPAPPIPVRSYSASSSPSGYWPTPSPTPNAKRPQPGTPRPATLINCPATSSPSTRPETTAGPLSGVRPVAPSTTVADVEKPDPRWVGARVGMVGR